MVWLDADLASYLTLSCYHGFQIPYVGFGSWAPFFVFRCISGFRDRSGHPVRSRNIIHVSNGVVRCGFGIVFVGFVRI